MRYLPLLAGVLLLFTACNHNPLDVDISDVEAPPLRVLRLEKDMQALDAATLKTRTSEIRARYGPYYDHYLMNFLNRGGSGDSLYAKAVLAFVGDRDIRETMGYIRQIYPDTKIQALAEETDRCVKRFHYHFPARPLPNRLITVMSGWNYSCAYTDSALVVSLDMYLGDTAKFYQMLRLPQYQTRKMTADYILPDLVRGWMITEFDNGDAVNTLLYNTIFYGRLFYAVNALLPETADSLLIGYTAQQMSYCKTYEKKLWGYFAEKNRLYESNLQTVRELTGDGPFTAAISKECPPRIAMWVGWQIVRSYMKNNKEVTLGELMGETDLQKILNKSKYRP